MKIVITNAYSWYNKGDAGILLATIDTLKRIYSNPEFYVLSFTPDEDKKRYCKDKSIKEVYSNILNPHPYSHTRIGKIHAIIKLGFKLIKSQIELLIPKLRKKNSVYALLEMADIIIVCGGGFLGGKKFDSLQHLYQIYINTKFKKTVYIVGTSVEPIKNKIIKGITEFTLKKVDYIFAREIITYNYLSTFLPKEKYGLIPDIAFMLEDKNYSFNFLKKYKENKNIIIGITVRKWNFPNSKNSYLLMKNYINELSLTLDYFIEKKNAIFVFVPQVIVDYGNDTDVAKLIKQKLNEKNQDKFLIYENDWSPYELKSLISNFDCFVGTRMHSNIFATSVHVPTVAIAYEKKTVGIMNTLELNNYVISIENIKSQELINMINLVMKNKKTINKHLKEQIIKIREKILCEMKEKLTK